MKQKHVSILVSAGAAIVILLLMILWSDLSFHSESGHGPSSESGVAALLPLATVQLVESVAVHDFGSPDEWHVAGSVGQTYTETLSGAGLRIAETSVLLGQSAPDGPYIDWYAVGRAYAGWDTSALPDGVEILSATLTLDLPASGGRTEAFDIVIYRGDWIPPIDLDDWLSPAVQAVGRWHLPVSRIEEQEMLRTGQGITLHALEPSQTMRVFLDPGVVEVEGMTRLELRHAGEGHPPILAEIVPLDPSQIRMEVAYRP